jgi:hypothetical protein
MEPEKNVKLSSSEISQLWVSYVNDSAMLCKLSHFIAKVEDEEIRPVVQHALDLTQAHLTTLTEIFNKENYPIPYGFKLDEDVDVSAPRLYSDNFVLQFLQSMGSVALQAYSVSLSFAVRADVYSYFNECLHESTVLLRMANEVLLSKGLYIRSPFLTQPDHIDFVKSQNFLQGYLGDRRPLTALEITNLYANFQRNALGAATMIGFSQVAKNTEVRKFMIKGKEIAQKHCEVFGSILRENDIPVPMTWDTEITDSTTYTFSDKMIMFFTTALIALSIGYYGTSVSVSPRKDLGLQYPRLTQEIGLYAEDGANIMIKNGWLEEPPRALDRDELAKKNQ